jgi:acetyl esterase/lipase
MASAVTRILSRPGCRDLHLDIYPPRGAALGAAVILLHGGGWMVGDRADVGGYAEALAHLGFTAIAAEYRLLREAAWPAQIEDARAVAAFVIDSAEDFGVSPSKVALMGFSAGAHLALIAAGTPSNSPFGGPDYPAGGRIAAVVSAFGPPEVRLPRPGDPPSPATALLGPSATEETAKAASPLTYVAGDFPATMLISGTRDGLVPYTEQIALFAALEAAGVPADLRLYHGHAHEFTRLPSMLGPVMADVALFLKRVMVDPAYYARENEALNPFARPGFPPLPPAAPPAQAAAQGAFFRGDYP